MARGTVKVTWRGPQFRRAIEGEIGRRMKSLGSAMLDQLRQNIGVPTATAGPSTPGEFPHADTQELLNSTFVNVHGLFMQIGARAPHAAYVEETRPFLSRTLHEMEPEIRRRLTRKMSRNP